MPAPDQFWLMAGDVPTGPFTVAQVHEELAAGRATWQTPACPVGGSTWRPLLNTHGFGPAAAEFPPATPLQSSGTEPSLVPDGTSFLVQPEPPPGWWARMGGRFALVAFLVLVVGLGIHCAAIQSGGSNSTPNAFGTQLPPTAKPTSPAAGWNLGGPPRVRPLDPATRLVGSWRSTAGGFSSTFQFEADGRFTYYVSGGNPVTNLPAAAGGEAYGRWSVRDGVLFVEYTGASQAVLVPVFRGIAVRSPVAFTGDDAVRLTGVELDDIARTYARVRLPRPTCPFSDGVPTAGGRRRTGRTRIPMAMAAVVKGVRDYRRG